MGLFFEPDTATSQREVCHFSAEELARFKDEFTTREKRRWWLSPLSFAAVMAILGVVATISAWVANDMLKDQNWMPLFVLPPAILLLLAWNYSMVRRCPACRHNVDHTVGSYCPCCGGKSLNRGAKDWECVECGVKLRWNEWIRSRPRKFLLRTCSVCGVKLHETGI
jgi:hypothetical protein